MLTIIDQYSLFHERNERMSITAQYIFSIIAASIFISITRAMLPGNGAVVGAVKLIGGLFLMIAVLSPFAKEQWVNLCYMMDEIETDSEEIIMEAQAHTVDQIRQVIKQQTESYILEKAAKLSANIEVDVIFQQNERYHPYEIKINGAVSPFAKQQLTATISESLGIPEEKQIWD